MANGGTGGAGGAGGGYNIPVSLSLADSYATPQNVQSNTVFNFSSPFAGVEFGSQQANPVNPATATSSAAQRDAYAETTAPTTVSPQGQPQKPINWTMIAAIAGISLVLAIVVYKKL